MVQLDLTGIVAGIRYRGEFEECITKAIYDHDEHPRLGRHFRKYVRRFHCPGYRDERHEYDRGYDGYTNAHREGRANSPR